MQDGLCQVCTAGHKFKSRAATRICATQIASDRGGAIYITGGINYHTCEGSRPVSVVKVVKAALLAYSRRIWRELKDDSAALIAAVAKDASEGGCAVKVASGVEGQAANGAVSGIAIKIMNDLLRPGAGGCWSEFENQPASGGASGIDLAAFERYSVEITRAVENQIQLVMYLVGVMKTMKYIFLPTAASACCC